MNANEILNTILIFVLSVIGFWLIRKLLSSILKGLNLKKELRYKHIYFIYCILVASLLSFMLYMLSIFPLTFLRSVQQYMNTDSFLYFLVSFPLSALTIFKTLYKRYLKGLEDIIEEHDNVPSEYELDEKYNKVYLIKKYAKFKNAFMITRKVLTVIFGIFFGYAIVKAFTNINSLIVYVIVTITILVYIDELIYYFDGVIKQEDVKTAEDAVEQSISEEWRDLDKEYEKLWPNSFSGKYVTNKRFSSIQNLDYNEINVRNNSLYGSIWPYIVSGKNVIIESNLLESFDDIIYPTINLLFTAKKKILFLCDNANTVNECKDWFAKIGLTKEKGVSPFSIKFLNYDGRLNKMVDNNVDIFVGTPDMVINYEDGLFDIDVVFGVNIDNGILTDSLNLNILASILESNNDNKVQYVLFGNRAKDLRPIASQIFMSTEFYYLTVDNYSDKTLNANFFNSEICHFQNEILPGYSSAFLGQSIPLSIPALKCGVDEVNVITKNQAYKEEFEDFKMSLGLLKVYLKDDVNEILKKLNIKENENFINVNDKSVLTIDDYDNLAMQLLNWEKYSKDEIYLNIVSYPYMLRDYISSNIDFFISNVEIIGYLLPFQRNNAKLSLYRLISQLCYGKVPEEILLREINKISSANINTNEMDQKRIIITQLHKLTKEIFDANIYYEQYLIDDTINNSYQPIKRYKLIPKIKEELPKYLFNSIRFVDFDQKSKILKYVPAFEVYQNYLPGQNISLDGNLYKIDNIDFDNSCVELTFSSNNGNYIYRQCKNVDNLIINKVIKELPTSTLGDSIITREICMADFNIKTDGYYEFLDKISLVPGEFSYNKVNNVSKLDRNYKNTNVFKISIINNYLRRIDKSDAFRIGFTISLLLNELFTTLYSNINQYIIARVITNSKDYLNYKDCELVKMYSPVIVDEFIEGINLIITEDTELEKGILDSIENNFDKIILPILIDYISWLIEDNRTKDNTWYKSKNNDYIKLYEKDKLNFLKYGFEELDNVIDLENTLELLKSITIKGTSGFTNNRLDFISKRNEYIPKKHNKKEEMKNQLVLKDSLDLNKASSSKEVQMLRKYNEEGFYHKTKINNLKLIFKEQNIYSKNMCKNKKIKYEPIKLSGLKDILKFSLKKYVRSYLRKNAPFGYKLNNKTCVLVIDYDILNDKSINSSFLKKFCIFAKEETLKDEIDFSKTFENKNKDYMNAEYHCLNQLPVKYISKIVFNSEKDLDEFKKMNIDTSIELEVNNEYFKN